MYYLVLTYLFIYYYRPNIFFRDRRREHPVVRNTSQSLRTQRTLMLTLTFLSHVHVFTAEDKITIFNNLKCLHFNQSHAVHERKGIAQADNEFLEERQFILKRRCEDCDISIYSPISRGQNYTSQWTVQLCVLASSPVKVQESRGSVRDIQAVNAITMDPSTP